MTTRDNPQAEVHLRRAPFLVWPVARREFYTVVAASFALPILWGILIFGWRALVVLVMCFTGAMVTHRLLRRFTRRGKELVTAHTLLSVLMLVALSQALWPPVMMLGAGVVLVCIIWCFGGAGRERLHASLVVAVALASWLGMSPLPGGGVGRHHGEAKTGTILARNRLFMGDLIQSAPRRQHQWPLSAEISGQDAVELSRPGTVVADALASIRKIADSSAATTAPSARAIEARVTTQLYHVFAEDLPPLETIMLGLTPGPIGAVSALGIVLGGLYLAYRNILRPRSCFLFLLIYILSMTGWTLLTWGGWRIAWTGLGPWQVIPPQELITLMLYEFFSSDILLAAVFILALPGT
ncbi:MAG: RnfABCDGE type electron transport complex subunit D, partial [Phycisphaerae bacterium]